MSDYYRKLEDDAAAEIKELLDKPLSKDDFSSAEEFDPWEVTPFYGTYSSEFDDIALHVLQNLLKGEYGGESIGHEMFREMLCRKNLCDYGTSPRVCFPTKQFKKQLPALVSKWQAYSALTWGDDNATN